MRRLALALLLLILPGCGLAGSPAAEPIVDAEQSPPLSAPPVFSPVEAGSQSTSPTTPPPTTDIDAPAELIEVSPYFLVDEAGHHRRTGPFLVPVAREVPATKAVARAAMEQLLAGPTDQERGAAPAISSAIPEDVRLLGLTIEAGTATVDLSSGFALGEDAAAVAQRVAQVVFTLTRFDTVERVRFLEAGEEGAIPTSTGDLVRSAVTRADYLEFAPAIGVETPVHGGEAGDPARVSGFAAVFEATFRYSLLDEKGMLLDEGYVSTSNGTGWGTFDFTIDYDPTGAGAGTLIVWASSAEDGSPIDVREYPVILAP